MMDNNIRQMLSTKNMIQAELARRVGVKREYMNRIIKRKIVPGVPLGIKIARALGETVEAVFFLDED